MKLMDIFNFFATLFKTTAESSKTGVGATNPAPSTPSTPQSATPVQADPSALGETTLVTHINVPVETPRNITWVPSPNFSSRNGHAIRAIIMHHTASSDLKSAMSWLIAPESKVSAHYLIDTNGEIYQLVKEADKAWHAGNETNSVLHGIYGVNEFSIGIELVGDGVHEFPRAQYDAAAWVVKMLKTKYNIDDGWVVGHKDVALPPGRKTDPSPFNWPLFKILIAD